MTDRYEVIPAKVWQGPDGQKVSPFSAAPWYSAEEKSQWKLISVGWTIKDNDSGTIGMGRRPFKTEAEAQLHVERLNRPAFVYVAWCSDVFNGYGVYGTGSSQREAVENMFAEYLETSKAWNDDGEPAFPTSSDFDDHWGYRVKRFPVDVPTRGSWS